MNTLKNSSIHLCLLVTLFLSNNAISQINGTLDPAFGVGGKVITSFQSNLFVDIPVSALTADDKVLTATVVRQEAIPPYINIIRYLSNGNIDNSWGQNGFVSTSIANTTNISINDIKVQPDGKILLIGSRDSLLTGGNIIQLGLLVRYLPNGMIDNSFGNNGFVTQTNSNIQVPIFQNVFGYKLAIMQDKILAIGMDSIMNLRIQAYHLTNGVPYYTWGNNSVVRHNFEYITSTAAPPRDIFIQSDNKILVTFKDLVFRFLPTGQLDPTFANNGYLQPHYAKETHQPEDKPPLRNFLTVQVQPDDKILIASKASHYSSYAGLGVIERYMPNGDIDTSFANDGFLFVDLRTAKENIGLQYIRSLIVHENGDFTIAGNVIDTISGYAMFAMCQFLVSGDIDSTFGTNGVVVTEMFQENDSINCLWNVLIQSDSKIILNGFSPNYNIAPLENTGRLHYNYIMARYYGKSDWVSIENLKFQYDFNLYPNPVNDVLHINTKNSGLLTLYNLEGKLIIQKNLNDNNATLNTDLLINGVYFVHFTDKNGFTSIKKIIKQ